MPLKRWAPLVIAGGCATDHLARAPSTQHRDESQHQLVDAAVPSEPVDAAQDERQTSSNTDAAANLTGCGVAPNDTTPSDYNIAYDRCVLRAVHALARAKDSIVQVSFDPAKCSTDDRAHAKQFATPRAARAFLLKTEWWTGSLWHHCHSYLDCEIDVLLRDASRDFHIIINAGGWAVVLNDHHSTYLGHQKYAACPDD